MSFTENAPELFHLLGLSQCQYRRPLQLEEFLLLSSSAHTGRYKHAIDIATPYPDDRQTVVYAPVSGVIQYLQLNNTKWGPTPDFAPYLNYVNISVDGTKSEFVELGHIAPYIDPVHGLVKLEKGMHVNVGDPLATIGMNGFIEAPQGEPDPHLHMLVGQGLPNSPDKFKSLVIRWAKNK
jgi:hypothetical protein